MKRYIKFYLTIFIAIVASLGLIFGRGKTNNMAENSNSSPAIFKEGKDERVDLDPSTPAVSAHTKKYENSRLDFSFNYPDGFSLSEFPEDESKTSLIIKNIKTAQTIQVYVTAYDDPNFAINAERIKKDIPDLPISNSADVVVGGKAKGVAFFTENEAFGGETAEVWFADGKNFYQATTYGKDARLLEEIVKSWKFI